MPEGVQEAEVRRQLLDEFGIEIAGGLGVFKGKIWRIGLMGTNATRANVVRLLEHQGSPRNPLSHPVPRSGGRSRSLGRPAGFSIERYRFRDVFQIEVSLAGGRLLRIVLP